MKRLIVAFIVLLLLVPAGGAVAAGGHWIKIKDHDGIKSYERTVPGTDLKEFMAVTTIDARMEVIGEVLRDVSVYPRWITDCAEAVMKKKYDRNTFVLYLILNPPLIEKRDIVLKDETLYDYENGNAVIKFFCTHEVNVPVEKNRTRVTEMNGLYKMEYLGRNRTKFIYKLRVDPSGSIPKKLAYAVMKKYPHDTLKKLKQIVGEKKYSDAARGSIEEREINRRASDELVVKKIFGNNILRAVENKPALESIIAAENENFRNIAASGGAYETIHRATRDILMKYIAKVIEDKTKIEQMKNNRRMNGEITDLITTFSEASGDTVDSIAARYSK